MATTIDQALGTGVEVEGFSFYPLVSHEFNNMIGKIKSRLRGKIYTEAKEMFPDDDQEQQDYLRKMVPACMELKSLLNDPTNLPLLLEYFSKGKFGSKEYMFHIGSRKPNDPYVTQFISALETLFISSNPPVATHDATGNPTTSGQSSAS